MTIRPTIPLQLFYSYAYARRDERLRNELEKHLSALRNQGYITDWHNRKIVAGKEWAREVDEHFDTAHIILLLVSPDFMASNYCNDVQIKRAMERHDAGEARVIPILLRPVDWHDAPFGKLQALPFNGKPISSWQNTDEALYQIAQEIRRAIESLTVEKDQIFTTSQTSSSSFSATTNNANNARLERPATAFLSYKREDAEQVKSLQLHLKVRGVRAWRDVTNIPLGGFTEHAIIQAIKQESDAFVIYITPECLKSDYIWEKEVPAALQRWEQDQAFNIVPILQGVTFAQVQHNSTIRGYRSLTEFNAVSLPDPNQDIELYNQKLREISQRILKATFALRLRRIGAEPIYEPYIVLRVVDFAPTVSSLDLDLDWAELFTSKKEPPPEKVWDELLLPALEDVKRELSAQIPSHKLHIDVQAYLPAPFTLGHAIPETSRFTLLLEGQNETWSTKGTTTDPTPLQKQTYNGHSDLRTAIVVITIERNIAQDVARNIPILGISYKQHLHFSLPGRIDSASQAFAISHQIRQELRDLCDKGITHIHLFAALPAALAVMIGYQFNALCPITLYYYKQAEGLYVPVCTLDKP